MESNLLAVAFICSLFVKLAREIEPEGIAGFVARLYELNAELFKLAPEGSKLPGVFLLKDEANFYTQAQNLVSIFSLNSGIQMALCYNADVPESHPGSRLRLEFAGTSRDRRQPLYLQADVSAWQAVGTPVAEETEYANETEILQHTIGWNVWGEGSEEITELDSCSTDHIDSQIRYGFSEGELSIPGANDTYRGYWAILK